MAEVYFVIVSFILAVYCFKQWWTRFNSWNDFPGPSKYASFPIVGHAYKMAGRKMYQVMRDNREKYGDIYRFDIGNVETVYLCNYEDIREAFNSDAFGGRSFDMLPGYVHTRIRDKDGDLAGLATMVNYLPIEKALLKF